MDKIKILVVDDHAIMRDGLHALLSLDNDIEIVGEASEGKEAIEKVHECNPDIIIMDIAMPGMDGLQATHCLVNENRKAKVLILTQYSNKDYVLSAIKAGAAGYLPKSALGSELLSAIRAIHNGDHFLPPSLTAVIIEYYRQQKLVEPYDRLTSREREILKLISAGHKSREIAYMLLISVKTVQGHRTRIMKKLNIHNHAELIRYTMRHDIVSVGSQNEQT